MKNYVVLSFLLLWGFCSCGQKQADDNVAVFHILNSFVEEPDLPSYFQPNRIRLKPQEATVKLSQGSANSADIVIDYHFAYDISGKASSFSLAFEDIKSDAAGNELFEIQAEHIKGTGTIDSEQFVFEDVSLSGKVGTSDGSSLIATGLINGKKITLTMDSFTDQTETFVPEKADDVTVDESALYELSFRNDSGTDCSLSFVLWSNSSEEIKVKSGQTYQNSVFTGDLVLWGEYCTKLVVSFADGFTAEYSGSEVDGQKENVTRHFQRTSREPAWYLHGGLSGAIEKRYYNSESFSIHR